MLTIRRQLARIVARVADRRVLDPLADAILRRRADQEAEWNHRDVPDRDERAGRILSHLERLELASLSDELHRGNDRTELDDHVAWITDLYQRREEMAWQIALLEDLVPEFGRSSEPDYVPLSQRASMRLAELRRERRASLEP